MVIFSFEMVGSLNKEMRKKTQGVYHNHKFLLLKMEEETTINN